MKLHFVSTILSSLAIGSFAAPAEDPCFSGPVTQFEGYFTVTLQEASNRTSFVDVLALQEAAPLAYNEMVDMSSCSDLSVRSVGTCEVIIENILFERDVLLMTCNWDTNSIDGDVFLRTIDETIPVDPSECRCPPPLAADFLVELNSKYSVFTDQLGENVTVVEFRQAEVLTDCTPRPNITYTETSVCLPATECAPDCWCIPDNPLADGAATCPAIGSRTDVTNVPAVLPEIGFFGSIIPMEDSQYTLDPPGCQPFPTVSATFNQTLCTGVASPNPDEHDYGSEAQCSFYYEGDICDGGTYSIYEDYYYEYSRFLKKDKSKKSKLAKKNKKDKKDKSDKSDKKSKSAKSSKGGITHKGSCGVCSGAQDLAAYLSVTLLPDAQACAFAASVMLADPTSAPTALPTAIGCHVAMGFTPECAMVWASGAIATSLEVQLAASPLYGGPDYTGPASCVQCAQQCLLDPTNPECLSAFVGNTCELAPCVACEEEAIEPVFQRFSGRSRRRSGILGADIKRSCSTIPDIDQPFVTCPAPDVL